MPLADETGFVQILTKSGALLLGRHRCMRRLKL